MPHATDTRRHFLQASTSMIAAGAATAYFPWSKSAFANESSNDRPRVGCIGVGGRGYTISNSMSQFGDVMAVCDVDAKHLERAKTIGKHSPDAYSDYHKLLDRKDIDVVCIGAPDHWHAKIAVEAMQAGKHVYCEKPLTLTIDEGKLIRKAVKKYKKVFQVGTQQRSGSEFLNAVALCHAGRLGKLKHVQVQLGPNPRHGKFKKTDPPKQLDWEKWQGQTPLVDYISQRCHGTFRWWFEYSGGKLTDWGAHHMDIATWGIGMDSEGMGPTSIESTAELPVPFKDGYPTVDNQFNMPTAYTVNFKYPNGVDLVVLQKKSETGVLFTGTKGRIRVTRGALHGKPAEDLKKNPLPEDAITKLYKGKLPRGHVRNFFECIRDGGEPVSDVFSHMQALNTCHLANISIRLGRAIKWDPKNETIVGDDEANTFLARTPRKGYEIKV